MQTISPSYRRSAKARAARLETAALYGSFALISAVVIGTLSLHPF